MLNGTFPRKEKEHMKERQITTANADEQLRQLYQTAFPEGEQIPWDDLMRLRHVYDAGLERHRQRTPSALDMGRFGGEINMKKELLLLLAMLNTLVLSAQDIERFVLNQMQTYPKSRLLDIYKSCFQDYMGAEHLVSDRQRVKAYLDEELNTTGLDELMPWYYEPCGIDSCYYRVSLRVIKEGLITEDFLLDAFIRSANGRSSESLDGRVVTDKGEANSGRRPSVESWRDRWHIIVDTIDRMKLDLPKYQEDTQFIDSVLSVGKYAISHSPEYREAYHPHYRIVERSIFEKEIQPHLK